MNWSRAKTILIILFLCTNVFLLTALALSSVNKSVVSEEIISSTVDILERNGVKISAGIIPEKSEILPVIDLQGERTENTFIPRKQVRKFMKENNLTGEERIESVKNITSVLLDFISHPEHNNTEIVSLEQGYSVADREDVQMLVPSWKIVTADGKEYVMTGNG